MPHPNPVNQRRAGPPPLAALAVLMAVAGCGTTRMSDSKRTATEQLLVSEAVERAVMRIDMRPLAGYSVYLETTSMDEVDDAKYLNSSLRHQLLASGCRLAEKREDANIVIEARAGTIGTDRNEVVLGVPSTSITVKGNQTATPELAVAKRSEQRGVVKVSLCAYDRQSGRAVWQSGVENVSSHARDRWYFGAGPYQDGEIYEGVLFAGAPVKERGPAASAGAEAPPALPATAAVDLRQPHVFAAPPADEPSPLTPATATVVTSLPARPFPTTTSPGDLVPIRQPLLPVPAGRQAAAPATPR